MKVKENIPNLSANKGELDQPSIKSPNLFPVVGIGASAGGLDAFKKLLKAIPEDSGMAYVLVQHLDPKHESLLPELLQKVTKIPVIEITDDIKVHPDHIYVIPSNKMMVATDGVLLLAPRPEKNNTARNLPIDLFFKSLAQVHQEHAIGVVLSGTASDGTQGLKAIKEHGGITFAQDEASAEYEGMPHSAVQAGVVDFVLPPGDIPKKLLEVTNKTIRSDEELQNIPKQDEEVFKQILSLLRIRKGVDFTYYKQSTIRRRIIRRMLVNKNEETGDYLKFLRGNNLEQDLLYQDMLIPVTSFFRDKKVFENLCNNVFPEILKNKVPGEITRIWVAGCSTGQEAFSVAMCFKEFLGDNHEKIQIFGTDLSELAIAKARAGLYEKSEVDGVSPERLKEHFTRNNGGYQINKSIRDMCVFAHHNFLKDPPFGKMDMITCRNVLIYMESYLQKKALTAFHYSLNPKGFLLLGKSETTGGVPDLFAAVEKTDKLYTRKDVQGRFMQVASQRSEKILNTQPDNIKSEPIRTDFQKTADEILLTKYTPAGVVVNETMDIVHFRGNTANYLQQAPGKPSHNLLMMAKNGLGFELRNILHKAKADKLPVVKDNIPLSVNGSLRNISIEAVPLPNTLEPYYLVLFHDNTVTDTDGSSTASGSANRKKVSAKTKKDEKDIQIKLLEQELAQAREDMRSITEDQEASNEELQSANEELLSSSEELQSLNEELETSKEELQSTNEELTVLNHELISLNEQVTDARNYSESIVATLYQPLLVLDKHLRVKTANKAFYKTFKVNEQETEGVLIYDLGNRQWNIPELRKLLEEILPQKKSITDFEVTHNFSSIGERIILLSALEIVREKKEEKLILLSIEDITEKIVAQKKMEESEHRYHEMVRSSPSLIAIFKGENMIIEIANDAILESWGKGNIIGQSVFDAIPESVEQDFDKILLGVYKTGVLWQAFEVPVTLLRRGKKELVYYNILYQAQRNVDGEIEGVAVISTEVTPQAEYNLKLKASEEQFRSLVMQAPVAMCILKGSDFIVEVANKDFLQIVGKSENEYVGKPLFDSIPETRSIAEPLLLQVLNTGVPYFGNELEITIEKFGKAEKGFYNFVYKPVIGNNGTTTGIMVVANEVTEQVLARKKIEESEAKYRSLFDTMDQGFCIAEVIFDKDNNPIDYLFIEVNPVFEEQSGLKNALGKTALELIPNLEKHWFDIYGKVVTTGESIRLVEGSEAMGRMFDVYAFKVGEVESSRVAILFTDITERKRVEKNLIESEERFRSLVMATSDTVYKMSADWKIMYNLEGKDFLANTIDSDISWLEKYIPEAERPLVMKAIEEAIAKKKIFELEHQVFDADGNIAWTYSRAVPKLNEAGEIMEWTGAASNITERKKAQRTLVASESRFRNLVEKTTTPICILKGDDMVLDMANDSVFKIWHVGKETIGKPLFEILPEMKDQPFMGYLLDVYKNGVTHYGNEEPAYYVRENGEIETVYFNFVFQPFQEDDGIISGVMVLGTDITEQVIARKKIEESEEKFSTLAENMENLAWLADEEGSIYWYNKRWYDYTGTTLEEMKGWGWQKVHHPDHVDRVLDFVKDAWYKNESFELTFPLRGADGEYKWFLTRAYPMADEQGKVIRWIGTNTNIDEQKKAAVEINYSKALLEAHNEASIDGILLVDAKGKILSYNHKFIEIWNMPPHIVNAKDDEAALAFATQQLIHPEQFIEKVKYLYEHPTETSIDLLEFTDGKIVERHGYPVTAADGSYYAWSWTFRDVTTQKLYEKNIEKSEEHFKYMANNMAQKVWTANAEGNKTYFNQTFLDYTGLTFEEINDGAWKKIIHPDDFEENERRWEHAVATGSNFEIESRFRRNDGKFLWHLTLAVPLKDTAGSVTMWIGTKTEIQEQKEQKDQLEKSVEKRTHELVEINKELEQKNTELFIAREELLTEYSRSLIEASLDPLITINSDGKITDMNQATVTITGFTREQLNNSNFYNYFTEPQKARDVYKMVFTNGNVINSPLTLRHVNGKLTDVFLNGSVYKNNEEQVVGVVLVARDVTEEKKTEQALIEAKVFAEKATLAAEKEKQKALEATQVAEAAVIAKQQFLSNMSHEIRTPMNAIIGFTKVILKTNLNAQQTEYLQAINLSGQALIVLINDILDLAKVDAGKMIFEQIPFKLQNTFTAILHLFENRIKEKNLQLIKEYDTTIPTVLLGDPVRLHQIILNLISNAVKFTSKGSISISVRMLTQDETNVELEFIVADTGIGIPADKTETVFENFHQATSETSRMYGGTGLGLAIVKKLVEAQGGFITVTSKINEGSAFRFSLVFQKTNEPLQEDAELIEIDKELRNIKVLVVEDMSLNQLLMKTILDEFGFERDIAANGKIAIEKMQNKTYDIILMDLQMPEMNGFEATEYIRNTLHSKIPIIALTADVTTVDFDKCKAAGMNDYIAKPVDEKLLYTKIVGLVKKETPIQNTATENGKLPLNSLDIKRVNLTYLQEHTRVNTVLIKEMIEIYLEQTPPLLLAIKESFETKNWALLYAATHKLIPSFSIMGIDVHFENSTRIIQNYARQHADAAKQGTSLQPNETETTNYEIAELIVQVQQVCQEACTELITTLQEMK